MTCVDYRFRSVLCPSTAAAARRCANEFAFVHAILDFISLITLSAASAVSLSH